jgi:sulfide:quinone oxidoreductase
VEKENGLGREVAIIGGGTAGITVAARLRRGGVDDIAVVEPSDRRSTETNA